ncbi:MAG: penicillin acylase family protein [Acidobacteriota bacterium]|nr:penicillin acylase family protein [Acidobacteriota bacterium]
MHGGPGGRPALGLGMRVVAWILPTLLVLTLIAWFAARHYIHRAMHDALPVLDGTIHVPAAATPGFGLGAPVTVARDVHGVPHIRAASIDDLVFAQGYITAQDRLWQMELLRRHAAGNLAEILGPSLLEHDRVQRTLQIRDSADRAAMALPADQRHFLDVYARGVNASIVAQHDHLPLEFRLLQFTPGAWSPRDSLLIAAVMFQDLSTSFPTKLGREALAAHLPPELMADLYPVGSWRDHYPGQPIPDLTAVQGDFEEVPLDESQSRVDAPHAAPALHTPGTSLEALQDTLALFHSPCAECVAGSNSWAVAGSRSASGKPLLSDDMHLSSTVPGLWYEADLQVPGAPPAAAFHVAGLTLPGTPFVIVGHNDHVAWGFTNLGGDVQDLYIEHTRGTPGGAEYLAGPGSGASAGTWQPIRYHREIIHVRGAADVTLDVPLTRHGDADTPVISSIFPGETRTISLRWTLYDPTSISDPFFAINSAGDWPSMLAAFSGFGGPSQNMMYADDAGHIGYHAVGRVPIRGDHTHPAALSPVPTETQAAEASTHEWVGYIPFEQMPQAFDPPDGVLATANGSVTAPGSSLPITLDWMAPYRTERIYKLLETVPGKPTEPRRNLSPADMLAIQTDVHSELDLIYAQKLAYAIDHTDGALKDDKTLHQAADILRRWDGEVLPNASAPAIVNAARNVFWTLLLVPHLAPQLAAAMLNGTELPKDIAPSVAQTASLAKSYAWGERPAVEEQLLMHQPARWLPSGYSSWNNFLASVVHIGLHEARSPRDLSKWTEGRAYPLVLQHPILSRSAVLARLVGEATGPGTVPQRGDGTTITQVGRSFGPSERSTVDLGNLDSSTLNLVLGQSGNVSSPWYMDQFAAWHEGTTFTLPYSESATRPTIVHTLTLTPR